MTATAALLDFAAAAHRLPDAVRADALRLLADTLAVGAAGATAPGAAGVVQAAAGWGSGGDARLIGRRDRLPAPAAAFVNGFQIHCLEWDAVHEPAVVHALSVVTAAVLATLDRRGGGDPEAALVALAVGVDIAAGLGIAATSPLRFFRPATAGCLGAALAAARIDGIARDQLPHVLGLAYSFCAGTMQAHLEGSVALPLQIAHAARAALTAVDLVRAGLTGPEDPLEGPFGYFALFEAGGLERYVAGIGAGWRVSEVSVKPYPAGRASHGVLAALASLREDGRIVAVEAAVPPLVARLVGRPARAEMTPAYARLCLPALAAMMVEDGCIDPRRFSGPFPAALPVTLTADGNPDPNALSPQRVTVRYADGRQRTVEVPHTLGSPAAPLSPDQSAAKTALARTLALPGHDPRVFADPLAYLTEPQ